MRGRSKWIRFDGWPPRIYTVDWSLPVPDAGESFGSELFLAALGYVLGRARGDQLLSVRERLLALVELLEL